MHQVLSFLIIFSVCPSVFEANQLWRLSVAAVPVGDSRTRVCTYLSLAATRAPFFAHDAGWHRG